MANYFVINTPSARDVPVIQIHVFYDPSKYMYFRALTCRLQSKPHHIASPIACEGFGRIEVIDTKKS